MPTKNLPKCKENTKTSKIQQCDSAIGLHLLRNQDCANNYNDQQFSFDIMISNFLSRPDGASGLVREVWGSNPEPIKSPTH